MLDSYVHGKSKRISPEAPVPVVHLSHEESLPGGAANVAVNLASLGVDTTLVGLVGRDKEADLLKESLSLYPIKQKLITTKKPTIKKTRIISQNQQLIRLDQEDSPIHSNSFDDTVLSLIEEFDVIVFSDYAKGALKNINIFLEKCYKLNKLSLVDPKGNSFNKYKYASLITPNFSEFTNIVGNILGEDEIAKKADNLCDSLKINSLLLTRSEAGMSYFSKDGITHYPAKAKDVYDVTGAGDTVIATLAASLCYDISKTKKVDFEKAINLANTAASVVVGKLGTKPIEKDELEAAVLEDRFIHQGFLSEDKLMIELNIARKKGESIVMTNGCFDILHTGHVNYLNQAKTLGDRLIVAINTDESIKRIKGDDRPANTLQSRANVLAALRAVDWVIEFSEETPERIIKMCLPDFLVKGGDNDPDNIPGAKEVRSYGGKVLVMDYIEGFSTTKTITKIKSNSTD